MARAIDRSNPAHAAAVLAALVPDVNRRDAIVRALGQVAEVAAGLHPASWSITLQHDLVRLNVGQILVFQIGREKVALAGYADAMDESPLRDVVEKTEGFTVMPGVILFKTLHTAESLELAVQALLPGCLKITREAARSRGPWRRAHSPGVVPLLERSLGHSLAWEAPDARTTISTYQEPLEERSAEQAPSEPASIGWLHLTDLHQGMNSSNWLWPNVLDMTFHDLTRLHEMSGPWDIVFFTGDLTQRGTAQEFAALDRTLDRLWKRLEQLGSRPCLIAVPGNHDLARPDPFDPVVVALSLWHKNRGLRDHVLGNEDNPYITRLREAFAAYTAWTQRAPWFVREGVTRGIIPGDLATSLKLHGLDIGIVALNSAFLQLTGANFHEQLDVDARQLHQVCGHDAPEWLQNHHINLLLTHHSPDWLEPRARQEFRNEIDSAGRFAAHFFGHMHEGSMTSTSHGGGQARHAIQGASLFGLEEHDGPTGRGVARNHGYSAGRFELVTEAGAPDHIRVRLFPRKMFASGGGRRIDRDVSAYDLDERGSFTYVVPASRRR